jgi:hypothetical protein
MHAADCEKRVFKKINGIYLGERKRMGMCAAMESGCEKLTTEAVRESSVGRRDL